MPELIFFPYPVFFPVFVQVAPQFVTLNVTYNVNNNFPPIPEKKRLGFV